MVILSLLGASLARLSRLVSKGLLTFHVQSIPRLSALVNKKIKYFNIFGSTIWGHYGALQIATLTSTIQPADRLYGAITASALRRWALLLPLAPLAPLALGAPRAG